MWYNTTSEGIFTSRYRFICPATASLWYACPV
jgi:hypothetical protein